MVRRCTSVFGRAYSEHESAGVFRHQQYELRLNRALDPGVRQTANPLVMCSQHSRSPNRADVERTDMKVRTDDIIANSPEPLGQRNNAPEPHIPKTVDDGPARRTALRPQSRRSEKQILNSLRAIGPKGCFRLEQNIQSRKARRRKSIRSGTSLGERSQQRTGQP